MHKKSGKGFVNKKTNMDEDQKEMARKIKTIEIGVVVFMLVYVAIMAGMIYFDLV